MVFIKQKQNYIKFQPDAVCIYTSWLAWANIKERSVNLYEDNKAF